jgi:hypothetical protein
MLGLGVSSRELKSEAGRNPERESEGARDEREIRAEASSTRQRPGFYWVGHGESGIYIVTAGDG